MIGNRLNLLEIGRTIRDGVVSYWAAHTDPEVEALPGRRLLLSGDPAVVAWDCEQFTVALQGIGNGQSDDTAATAPQLGAGTSVFNTRHAIFEILLTRCVSIVDDNGDPPPDAVLESVGERFLRDAAMLSQALTHIAAQVRPRLLDPGGIARVGQVLPVGPDGGFVGVVAIFQVTSAMLTGGSESPSVRPRSLSTRGSPRLLLSLTTI